MTVEDRVLYRKQSQAWMLDDLHLVLVATLLL